MKEKMENMMQIIEKGSTVDDAIYKVTGIDAAPIREKVHTYLEENRMLQAKYEGWDITEAVFHEIAERTNNDCAEQFLWLSGIKRQCSLRNLKYSESVLRDQGCDIEFMRESIEHAYEAEQQMGADATEEELEAMKQEVADALPEEDQNIRQALIRELDPEQAEPLLKALKDAENMTQEQEDYAVMVAAILMSEDDSASQNDAVAAAVWHTAEVFDFSVKLLLTEVPELLGETAALMLLAWLSSLAELGILSEVFIVASMATFFASAVVATIAGIGFTYVGLVKAIPYAKKACEKVWAKAKPCVEKAAAKAKNAVLQLAGVVVETVFRPAIYWVNNTAIPVIKEKVIYPMKRRLQAMLEWFHIKKEQFVKFIEDAKRYKAHHENDDNDYEDNINDYEVVKEYVTYGEEVQPQSNWVAAT